LIQTTSGEELGSVAGEDAVGVVSVGESDNVDLREGSADGLGQVGACVVAVCGEDESGLAHEAAGPVRVLGPALGAGDTHGREAGEGLDCPHVGLALAEDERGRWRRARRWRCRG
jgi:hypothetical protein